MQGQRQMLKLINYLATALQNEGHSKIQISETIKYIKDIKDTFEYSEQVDTYLLQLEGTRLRMFNPLD